MQIFFKIGVFKIFSNIPRNTSVLELLFNKVAGLEDCNFIKKRLQHSCLLVNMQNFQEHLFWRTSVYCCFCNFNHKVSVSIGHLSTFSSYQKHGVGWFLLRSFVDLVRIYSLLTIGRNHSSFFFFIDLQKKNLSKVKYCSKGYFFWYQDFDRFRQVVVHCLMFILMMCK